MNNKGRRIDKVTIINGVVTAYDEKQVIYKLTRNQRTLFVHYKDPEFWHKVVKEFSNEDILSPYFRIEHDGKVIEF